MLFIDFEVFKYDWLCVAINPTTQQEYVIINDKRKLEELYDAYKKDLWVGYNIRHYDQFILKAILLDFNPKRVNDWIIVDKQPGWKFSNMFYRIPLVFYDCMLNNRVSLKVLEAFMGLSIHETKVPFTIPRRLTDSEIADVVEYCRYDVLNAIEVFVRCKAEFEAYRELIPRFKLPARAYGKTKAQLTATILKAKRKDHNDEFDIQFPPTMKINRYTDVLDFYKNEWRYGKSYERVVAGVPHIFSTGGTHAARLKTIVSGNLLHIDVEGYYPFLNTQYPDLCLTRNIANPQDFVDLRAMRAAIKHTDPKLSYALKILVNAMGGATKSKDSPMYDPRQNNNMCIGGQLLLLDLIEKLEYECQLYQSNTDGLVVQYRDYDKVVAICKEWEQRTGAKLEYHKATKLIQGDVNNYILFLENGHVECVGGYVKDLNDLDYDLPIVNKAIRAYLIDGVLPEVTIGNCNSLREFQKIVRLSSKYVWVEHETNKGNIKYSNKAYRVFAQKGGFYGRILACKTIEKDGVKTIKRAKFANTPDNCFIDNGDVRTKTVPRYLDKQYYIDLARSRITKKFGVEVKGGVA